MARLTNSQVVLLRDSVSRVETLDEEIRTSQADKKEIYDTAKGAGLDLKQLRSVIRDRRRDPDEIVAENETYNAYAAALDGLVQAWIEERDAVEGEQGDDGREAADEERAADDAAVPAEEDAGREAGEGAAEEEDADQEGGGEGDEEPEPEHPHARLEPIDAEPAGFEAGRDGQSEDDNPCIEPESREAWAGGWNRAQDEIATEMELANGDDAVPDDL